MQHTQQIISDRKKFFYAWFKAMNTRVDLAFFVESNRDDLLQIASEIETEISKYEKMTNRFNPESELSYVNENNFGKAVKVSPELCNILADCLQFNSDSLGYFDITVNSFNACGDKKNVFIIHTENNTVEFTKTNVRLDLSGFIKGYTLKKIMDIVEYKCIDNALINIGNSSIFAKGNHPHGEGWKIRVPANGLECTLLNQCLTTSGNSVATKWPIINPLNGTIEKTKKPVSVITKDPAVGELLSKVAFLAPENELNIIFAKFDGRIIN
ncbi:MAG: FAD:protein FMN transferase [Paludibacter sp.]|nr:FAD:protein FMN transferase [Paludibacter sp.]